MADRAAVEALGGRDFAGQVVKEINGTTYILIGNEQQLRAIGSDERVYTPVYQAIYHAIKGWEVDKDENGLIQTAKLISNRRTSKMLTTN